jgi:hypothetical protein
MTSTVGPVCDGLLMVSMLEMTCTMTFVYRSVVVIVGPVAVTALENFSSLSPGSEEGTSLTRHPIPSGLYHFVTAGEEQVRC